MFKKLLKHDIKDNYFEVLILSGVLIVLSLCSLISINFNILPLFQISIAIFGFVILAMLIVTMRAVIKCFYTKLFTDNGYLTLTTPVSIDKILLSKIFVSMLCVITSVVASVISVLIFFAAIGGGGFDLGYVGQLGQLFLDNFLQVLKYVLFGLTYCLYSILVLLFILTLSNTGRMRKHKWLKGILIYIVLAIVMQQITKIRILSNEWVNFIMTLGFSAGLYFLSRYIIINKLELE